jgi:hypothetical protein
MFGFSKEKRRNKALSAAAQEGNVRDITRLLDDGADIEWRNPAYWEATPLGVAVHRGHFPAARVLIERGAQVENAFRQGDTTLMFAIYGGNADCIRELLQHGASTTAMNDKGLTAIDLTKDRNEAVRLAMGLRDEPKEPPKPPAPPDLAPDPDEIVLRRKIGDKILEEVFNFSARERVSLIRGAANGPVETMTRENFDDIGERALRRAFEAYARQGGAIPEAEVFPQAMAKVKPQPRAG